MSDITLSAGVRANLLSLQNTAQLMQTTQNRLATGKKVNSALDNPLSYFTSQSLGSRANDLSALLDSMSNGIQTIQAANNGLTSITSTVQSMQSTLNQALQDKSFQTASFSLSNSVNSGNISFSGGSIGSTPVSVNIMKAGGTTVNATNAVATGSSALGSLTVSGTAATHATVSSASAPTSPTAATNAVLTGTSAPTTIDTTAKGAVLTGTTAFTSVSAGASGSSFDITTAAGTKTVSLSATGGDGAGNYSLAQLETAINGTTGVNVTASDDGNGHLILTSGDAAGGSAQVSLSNFTGNLTDETDLGLGSASANGTAAAAFTFTVNSQNVSLAAGSTYTASDIATQINSQAGASGKVNATVDSTSGDLVLTSTSATTGTGDSVTVGGANISQLGFTTTTAQGQAAGTASTVDVSGSHAFSFTLNIDGTPKNISIDATAVSTYNGEAGHTAKNATALSAQDIADLVNDQIDPTGATQVAGVSGGDLTFTSTTTGANSSLSISGYTSSLATGSSTGIANTTTPSNGAAASNSFSFTVNGQTVSLDPGTYSSSQIASAINSQVGVSAAVNATVDATSGKLTLTSTGTAGAANNVDIEFANSTDAGKLGFSTASVKANGSDASVSGGTEKTVDELVAEINGNTSLAGKITASNDNGSLRIQNNSTTALSVTGANSTAITGTNSSTSIAGDDVRKSLVNQFNTLRDQLDKFADDSSYNGVNLLRGDNLKLTLNETGTSALNIQAKDANGNTLTIDSMSLNINEATNSDFDSDNTINGMLGTLTTALSTLRSQASSFGSNLSIVQNRQNFTNSMINTLQTGGDNLVLADSNEEGANLLALQTRQSLSTTALSLSAQSDQAVLQLFG